MNQPEERWEAVSRVVFKANSGMERIVTGDERNRLIVCAKARLLRLTPLRVVSLDLVESYDLLEAKCDDCKAGMGYPQSEWWSCNQCCQACLEKHKRANDAKRAEEDAQQEADEKRSKALVAAMGDADQAAMRRFCRRWGIRL